MAGFGNKTSTKLESIKMSILNCYLESSGGISKYDHSIRSSSAVLNAGALYISISKGFLTRKQVVIFTADRMRTEPPNKRTPLIIRYFDNTGAIDNRFCSARGLSIGEQYTWHLLFGLVQSWVRWIYSSYSVYNKSQRVLWELTNRLAVFARVACGTIYFASQ